MTIAARSFQDPVSRGVLTPRSLRRMLAAAVAKGNLALARALGRRILARAPDEASDYGPDDGDTYRTDYDGVDR